MAGIGRGKRGDHSLGVFTSAIAECKCVGLAASAIPRVTLYGRNLMPATKGGRKFWINQGCHDRGTLKGRMEPANRRSAAVQCCSDLLNRCNRYGKSGCYSGTWYNNWRSKRNYNQAKAICEQAGKRLCTKEEIMSKTSKTCCGSGCAYDGAHVWTSTGENGADGAYTAEITIGNTTLKLQNLNARPLEMKGHEGKSTVAGKITIDLNKFYDNEGGDILKDLCAAGKVGTSNVSLTVYEGTYRHATIPILTNGKSHLVGNAADEGVGSSTGNPSAAAQTSNYVKLTFVPPKSECEPGGRCVHRYTGFNVVRGTRCLPIKQYHEMRCCKQSLTAYRDTKLGPNWGFYDTKVDTCSTVNVWSESLCSQKLLASPYSARNSGHTLQYVKAEAACEAGTGRACTLQELATRCAMGSGCSHDSDQIWSSQKCIPGQHNTCVFPGSVGAP